MTLLHNHHFTDKDGDELRVNGYRGEVIVQVAQGGRLMGTLIPNEDVPAVAAELLKAAGHNYLAGYIEADIDCRERTKEAEAEKKLQERRDALAAEFAETWGLSTRAYMNCDGPLRTAITRIIELEDGK